VHELLACGQRVRGDVLVVPTVPEYRLIEVRHVRAREQPEGVVVVGMDAIRGIEGAGGQEGVAGDEGRLVIGGEAVEEIGRTQPTAGGTCGEPSRYDALPVPEVRAVREDGLGAGRALEVCLEPRQPVREGDIVGILEGDPAPARRAQPEVARRGQAGVLARHHLDATAIGRQHLRRVVGRPVIHHHDLSRGNRLSQDAVQALGEPAGGVVARDDDRDHPQWLAAIRASTEGSTRPKRPFGRRSARADRA
jgi:hypothetical protein